MLQNIRNFQTKPRYDMEAEGNHFNTCSDQYKIMV